MAEHRTKEANKWQMPNGSPLAPYARMTASQRTALAAGAATAGSLLIARALRMARSFDFRGTSVLITGGSRGLGLLIARELGREGARITIAARDADELERAREDLRGRGIDAATITCDIGVKGEAARLVDAVVARDGRLDVLINNAGVIQVGPLDQMTAADFEEAMAVHFWGPLHAMLAAIPHMREQGGGRVVNVSSIGGKIGVPHLTPYCASKFALAGLSAAARAELAQQRIYVTSVCPGLMRTGSPFNAWFKGRHREEFRWFAIADSIPLASIDGARAARQLIDACRHGDAELIISWPAKLAVLANAVAPECIALAMQLANDLVLPKAGDAGGTERHSGWQSLSAWAPSTLTTLTNRAAAANNELPR
jgi:NAD(P)-dependent dehydrogenase (short-subunit alcohol dehydrogenase family)